MSVVGEVLGFVGCVAAVISAYRNGSQILESIKDKRRRSRGDPPSRYLEQSLNEGATVVQQTHRAGVDRFGSAFTEGDDTAFNDLRDITIQLQAGMLRGLVKALEDDSIQDFTAVVNASDTGRFRTVTVLNELFLRMQAGASRDRSLPPASADPNRRHVRAISNPSSPRQIEHSRAPPPRRVHTLTDNGMSETSPRPQRSPPASYPRQNRDSTRLNYIPSFRELFQRRTRRSDISDTVGRDETMAERDMQTRTQSIQQGLGRSQQGQLNLGGFSSISLMENPWISSIDSFGGPSPTEMENPRRRHTFSDQNPQQVTLGPMSTNGRTSQDFQGFCKGAYYLQVRLKSDGVMLRNESGSFSGEKYYYACTNSKCCFEALAQKTGKVWGFASAIFSSKCGVEFRWSFLAKSHIEQSKVKGRNFLYRCVFCALRNPESPVLGGVDSLIEHVAQHRHEQLPADGRILIDVEDFDLRFMAEDVWMDTESLGSRLSLSTLPKGSLWSMSSDINPWERP